MNIKTQLRQITKILRDSSSSPTLDAELLLSYTLKKPKEFLYAHPNKKLKAQELKKITKLTSRRLQNEPMAYIAGHKEFFGLDFLVNKNVLIPRPETEILIEEVIKYIKKLPAKQNKVIIDIGTGSGAIITSLAKNLPLQFPGQQFKFYSTEISTGAISIAQKNARQHQLLSKIKFLKGDLLKPLQYTFSRIKNSHIVITANLPYLTTKQWKETSPDVKKYEPHLALDGGIDGLKYYKKLLSQLAKYSTDHKNKITFFLEIDPAQNETIKTLIKQYFPKAKISIKKDLCLRDRVAIATL